MFVLFSSSQIYNEKEKVIALWEDSQYSYNLYRSSNRPTFGMLIFSKRLDTLAEAAIAEAMRLDNQEASEGELEDAENCRTVPADQQLDLTSRSISGPLTDTSLLSVKREKE